MPDPFLLAHYRAPLVFDIGSGLTPVAIRDQMVRGRLIVDRAYEKGLIGRGRPILVVGAGVAGVTAALRAAELQVRIVLIEQASSAFERQAGCRSRWIDPIQYDWPLDHWEHGEYHWMPPPVPLYFQSDRANALAARWANVLHQARVAFPHLHVSFQTVVNWPPALVGPFVTVALRCLRGQRRFPPRNFGMILFCTGFGSERSTIGSFSSYRFWDDDPLERADLGVKTPTPRILISGGGDGALQDFLRIITGRESAKGILREIFDPQIPTLSLLRQGIERRLQCVEDQAQRCFSWGNLPSHDHSILESSHEAYRQTVDMALRNGAAPLKAQIDRVLVTPIREIKLCYPCTHFGQCYALNRFLVLLVAGRLASEGQHVLLPQTVTVRASGVHHVCANRPDVCHGETHEVELQPVVGDCTTNHNGGTSVQQFEVVLIRHGVTPPPLSAQLTNGTVVSRPQARQILPYHSSS